MVETRKIGIGILIMVALASLVLFYFNGTEYKEKTERTTISISSQIDLGKNRINMEKQRNFDACTGSLQSKLTDPQTIQQLEAVRGNMQACFVKAFGEQAATYCLEAGFSGQYGKIQLVNENPIIVGMRLVGVKSSGVSNYEKAEEYSIKCTEAMNLIPTPSPEDDLLCDNDADCITFYDSCGCAHAQNKLARIPKCNESGPRCEQYAYNPKCVGNKCTIILEDSLP
ncbi:MAG: hypothetical protein V1835_00735 [Candidatus Micrarchaeota archaeon]